MNNLTFKWLNKNNISEAVELFNKYRIFYRQESSIEQSKNFLTNRINNNESKIIIAIKENKAVGFIQLYPIFSSVMLSKSWILNDLYIHEEYRKKGIAATLIEQVLEFAKSDGATTVKLSTEITNTQAQNLYEQMNFKKIEGSTFIDYKFDL
ncbi:GNAT family N-acetyltransferase [Flammeovirga kamogawensis]|uniref:GNAT family N-acetyltransferase n=1 Tax=Flammeovirga kamogawensis TaxID=373891 RepID=A0ABX8GUA2_9BACT|nr:GNAT family N-acetyltransferase [Flammeovirga kamogawensis]MBB6460061.1 ribosomal protein S18 acetylase RimI-like enzyme [Flammeovirga kamogawensis]QWG06893.1 GNAT family N-acetyltransferase [Flammeovirga kamogawensis]TRX68714.1 GNAT family N-acetyltransferase [Flammeovirga kamogawensis]